RPCPPCPGRTKAKSLTKRMSSGARPAGKSAALKLGTLAAHEREKLVARLLIVTESAEHGASDGLSMLFFHAAHLHAEMAGFDNHADTLRSEEHTSELQSPCNLVCRLLL